MAHQTWSQLSARLQGAMQNTIQIAFKLGGQDAVWAAPRFGVYNPLTIKHVVRDEDTEERTHPIFYSVQETYEGWAKALETLKPRHAYVRVGKKTVKIKTTKVPRFRSGNKELQRLRGYYADLLMHLYQVRRRVQRLHKKHFHSRRTNRIDARCRYDVQNHI